LVPSPKKKAPRKKMIVVKDKDGKDEKVEKNGWMVKYYTSLL
jgi:hypothetical protein